MSQLRGGALGYMHSERASRGVAVATYLGADIVAEPQA